jgi:hypothetical protein
LGGVNGNELASAAHQAFTTAMSTGMKVAASVALAGAAASFVLLRRQAALAVAPAPAPGLEGQEERIEAGGERTLLPAPAA